MTLGEKSLAAPENWTWVSCVTMRYSTEWATSHTQKIWVTVPVENQLQQLCDPSNQLIPNVDEISTEFCPGNTSSLQQVCQLYFFFLFEGLAIKPCGVKLRREGKEDNHPNRHSNLQQPLDPKCSILTQPHHPQVQWAYPCKMRTEGEEDNYPIHLIPECSILNTWPHHPHIHIHTL